jgi:hypothetical protein
MNKKLETDTLDYDFKKQFPTSELFVEWLLTKPSSNLKLSLENRMAHIAKKQNDLRPNN